MKTILIIAVALFVQQIQAQDKDIIKSIDTFFEGMHTSDTLKIKSVCADGMILQSVSETPKGEKFSTENMSEFYKSIASLPDNVKIHEKLLDYKVQSDGLIAHAWTPYEFYVNGKLSHSGVNSFQLYKENGLWKIVYILDTRRIKKKE